MTVTVPLVMPARVPLSEPMVATAVLLLTHEPPEMVSVSEIEDPTQTEEGPVIISGVELTETVAMA